MKLETVPDVNLADPLGRDYSTPAKPEVVDMLPPKRRSLWAIEDDLAALDDLVEEMEGDITECEPVIDEWFAKLGEEVTGKLDGYAAFIKELEARAEVRREEAQRLAKRAEIDANLADWLKSRMREFFLLRKWKKVETQRYRLTLCANGGKAPLKIDLPPEKLPVEYRREKITYSPDSDKIRMELETGGKLDWARIEPRGHHVRIT